MNKFDVLVEKGLVKRKSYPNGLHLYKYDRKVFFDNKWNEDALLLEARGIILDSEANVVQLPFYKLFNYLENDSGSHLTPKSLAVAVEKINGFMLAMTAYQGEMLVSTTGTIDSWYANLGRQYIEQSELKIVDHETASRYTLLFEVVDEQDPHIVPEEPGLYLIGARCKVTGMFLTEYQLDHIAKVFGLKRPRWFTAYMEDILRINAECRKEGYVVRDADTWDYMFKLKSPHYREKKLLMRMGKRKAEAMFDNPAEVMAKLETPEFRYILKQILRSDKVEWLNYTDQQRRSFIDNILEQVTC